MNPATIRYRHWFRRFARSLWIEWVRPLALPVLLITAAKSAFADINYVPTGSMKPTILEGDVVFINKLAYDLRVPFTTNRLATWAAPAVGEIVVCFAPDSGTRLVKRIVAGPGDTVEMRNEILYLNGARLEYSQSDPEMISALDPAERAQALFAIESLASHSHAVMALPKRPARRNFPPILVPAGQYFVLGDNRDNSHDSRFFGFVPRDQIVGRAVGVFVSADLNHWLRPRFGRTFSTLN